MFAFRTLEYNLMKPERAPKGYSGQKHMHRHRPSNKEDPYFHENVSFYFLEDFLHYISKTC